jgi:hypothetical protein
MAQQIALEIVEPYPYVEYMKYLPAGSVALAMYVAVMIGGGMLYIDDKQEAFPISIPLPTPYMGSRPFFSRMAALPPSASICSFWSPLASGRWRSRHPCSSARSKSSCARV